MIFIYVLDDKNKTKQKNDSALLNAIHTSLFLVKRRTLDDSNI